MRYSTLTEFIAAAQSGEWRGAVIIDNDSVYTRDAMPDHFGCGPEEALIAVLQALGIKAEYP